MNKENVLNLFYNEILPEASRGNVNAGFTYNTIFDSIIEDNRITQCEAKDNLYIPTLIIKNKSAFDEALYEYYTHAYSFYDKEYFDMDNKGNKYYTKAILSLIWSNATSEDFVNPTIFLKKNTAFIKNGIVENSDAVHTTYGNISYEVNKESIMQETPYSLTFKINNEELPTVRVGIHNNNAYVYAIHNKSKNKLGKVLNRNLYKVNENFTDDVPNDNDLYPENLSGITPSSLTSLVLTISLLKSKGISNFIAPIFLPVRWNAKEMVYKKKNIDVGDEHYKLQQNLSDKFIRTFRRCAHQFEGIEITSIPFVNDIDLHMSVDDKVIGNNEILNELYNAYNKHSLKL